MAEMITAQEKCWSTFWFVTLCQELASVSGDDWQPDSLIKAPSPARVSPRPRHNKNIECRPGWMNDNADFELKLLPFKGMNVRYLFLLEV